MDALSSDDDEMISIEDTYREVGQYRTHESQSPKHNSMTIIQEEELEDSAFISNFNSALQNTTYFKNTTAEPSHRDKTKNTDLDEVIEEPVLKSILKSSGKSRRKSSEPSVSPEIYKRNEPKSGI